MRIAIPVALSALLVATLAGAAAAADQELPLPVDIQRAYGLGTRSPDGNPGPNYWQNHAVHDISIEVTPPDRTVRGTETITYDNNSPYQLSILGVRLYLNARRPTAERSDIVSEDYLTDGIIIDRFTVDGVEVPFESVSHSETFKSIPLPTPIEPGTSVELTFDWHYDLALDADKEGVIDPTTFFLAYFFPRVSVINDYQINFDQAEFTYGGGRERNDDFADFSLAVTVPKDFVVWATGDLVNADEVLQPAIVERLAEASTSDETTTIATPEEIAAGEVTAQTDSVTWRFEADNVNDVALGLSDHFMWDAGSVVGDPETGDRVVVHAAYPTDAAEWTDMVDHGKRAIDFGVTQFPGVAWPYPQLTFFAGGANEEYPMMANDSFASPEAFPGVLSSIAAHEALHTYFPFYMGTNELRYPIMDEGPVTALEYLFNVQDRSPEEAAAIYVASRAGTLAMPSSYVEIPAILPADSLRGNVTGPVNAYGKGSLSFLALLDMMGEDAFKAALQEYMARWNGKHPLPWDMFNTFNDVSGQDLDWFWNNWYYEPNHLDIAVADVVERKNGYRVRVANPGGFAIPFEVAVEYADGSTDLVHQTAAVWEETPNVAVVQLPEGKEPASVTVGSAVFPDMNPTDNVWPVPEM